MVVLSDAPITAVTSYNLPLQPAPLLVMEYVSQGSQRKDYNQSFRKYERELQVPYYLIYYPDTQDLSLYRLREGRYLSVVPDERGRYAIPELEMELGLVEGWVRYWYQGELLLLPGALQAGLDEARRQAAEAQLRAEAAEAACQQAEAACQQEAEGRRQAEIELERLRRELDALKRPRS